MKQVHFRTQSRVYTKHVDLQLRILTIFDRINKGCESVEDRHELEDVLQHYAKWRLGTRSHRVIAARVGINRVKVTLDNDATFSFSVRKALVEAIAKNEAESAAVYEDRSL